MKNIVKFILVLSLFNFQFVKLSYSANYTWTGSVSIAWNNANNWSPNSGFPGTGDNATIVSADGKNIVLYIWYDNEYGYSHQVIRLAKYIAKVRRFTYY